MGKIKIGKRTLEITSEDRILFPKDKINKGDLIDYYKKIAPHMLPYTQDRAISMLRYPQGINKQGFYQKEAGEYFPKWIKTKRIKKKGGSVNYVVVNEKATLVYLANQGCISPHIWLSKIDKPNYPDKIVFDLDPAGKSFAQVRKAALLLKDKIEEHKLTPFAMVTGSKGIHVVIPIKRKYNFDKVRTFLRGLAKGLVDEYPKLLTLEARKKKRKNLVYIDILRNAFGQTTITPYAVRPIKGAPVATPISWTEVKSSSLKPDKFNIKNIFKRLNKTAPWKGFERKAKSLKI